MLRESNFWGDVNRVLEVFFGHFVHKIGIFLVHFMFGNAFLDILKNRDKKLPPLLLSWFKLEDILNQVEAGFAE